MQTRGVPADFTGTPREQISLRLCAYMWKKFGKIFGIHCKAPTAAAVTSAAFIIFSLLDIDNFLFPQCKQFLFELLSSLDDHEPTRRQNRRNVGAESYGQ